MEFDLSVPVIVVLLDWFFPWDWNCLVAYENIVQRIGFQPKPEAQCDITVAVSWPWPLFWSLCVGPTLSHVAVVYKYLWGTNTWIWLLHIHHPAPLAEIWGRGRLPFKQSWETWKFDILQQSSIPRLSEWYDVLLSPFSFSKAVEANYRTHIYLALTVNVFTFISFGYDFCPVHCLESSLQLCIEMIPYRLPSMLTSFHAHPCVLLGYFW